MTTTASTGNQAAAGLRRGGNRPLAAAPRAFAARTKKWPTFLPATHSVLGARLLVDQAF